MAQFLENIWESIFTAGPTPTLLIATNATFAALQLVLAVLLFLTYSIHFVVLSFLCGGLWLSINWFAREVLIVQAEQEEQKRREGASGGRSLNAVADVIEPGGGEPESGSAMDSGDDTETELEDSRPDPSPRPAGASSAYVASPIATGTASAVTGAARFQTAAASRLAPASAGGSVRQRRTITDSIGDMSSTSTDSEWEKIEDDR